MPCSIAQLCNQFEGFRFNGITAHFRRAPLSLIFFSLFLQVIGSLISFAAVLWTLWNRRNNLRLGKPTLSLNQVVEFAQDRILEKKSLQRCFSTITTSLDNSLASTGSTCL